MSAAVSKQIPIGTVVNISNSLTRTMNSWTNRTPSAPTETPVIFAEEGSISYLMSWIFPQDQMDSNFSFKNTDYALDLLRFSVMTGASISVKSKDSTAKYTTYTFAVELLTHHESDTKRVMEAMQLTFNETTRFAVFSEPSHLRAFYRNAIRTGVLTDYGSHLFGSATLLQTIVTDHLNKTPSSKEREKWLQIMEDDIGQVDRFPNGSQTLLHLAKTQEVFSEIVKLGADPSKQDEFGLLPVFMVSNNYEDYALARALHETSRKAGMTPKAYFDFIMEQKKRD